MRQIDSYSDRQEVGISQYQFCVKKTNNRGLIISEGIETVKLNNGDRLTITNSGCEFLTLNFRFETNRRSKNSQDPK